MQRISPRFGKARLYRQDVGPIERTYFTLFGLADPGHFIRSEYFKRYIHNVAPTSILDAGCGSGDYSFYLAERFPLSRITAIDRNALIIERNLRTRDKMELSNIHFRVQDLKAVDDSNSYDLITCIDVLQYIESPEMVISNFAKALKKNGYLYLHLPLLRRNKVPLNRFLKNFHADEAIAVRTKKTRDEVIYMIEDAKLNIEKSQYTFAHYAGELACSLSCAFYKDIPLNRLMQGFVSPLTRMLGGLELSGRWSDGFALAVLAKKLI
ncbi:MAG: class I SAM-dependent methyltransferase [Nitrospiraceae bacterium]